MVSTGKLHIIARILVQAKRGRYDAVNAPEQMIFVLAQ